VFAPEHTGNDALAPLGAFCENELAQSGVLPGAIAQNPSFDVARGEYRGQTFDPFFLAGSAAGEGSINPREIALTLDRAGDLRATLAAARTLFGALSDAIDVDNAAVIGYSRGAMHGVVAAELMPEVKVSLSLVGGTPLRFYTRDAAAAPLHEALALATKGASTTLGEITKPVLDIIGGEDSRRKATTDVAAAIGVYEEPSAAIPSPIVADTFEHLTRAPRALVSVADIDHFDLVDDPFVVAYRATGGTSRAGAFDATKTYVLRPLEERQQIRDHYLRAMLEVFLRDAPFGESFASEPFADRGVAVTLRGE
jgi:pimeloyl-ACP methyl ester carboxylesterase